MPAIELVPDTRDAGINPAVGQKYRADLRSRGESLDVPKGVIVALLGANGAGKTATLKAISNLQSAECGDVTKGAILFGGDEVQHLSPNELVRRDCIQVMEGRHTRRVLHMNDL
jgi:branched-chain amino acid transport system ATP-binding protein